MSYAKMMRWQKKHPRGGKPQYMGFHSGMFAPQNPPAYNSREYFTREALSRYKACVRCWRERREHPIARILDIFRSNRAAMQALYDQAEKAA